MADPLAAKSRKGKEREAPQGEDFFNKLIQLQRNKAGCVLGFFSFTLHQLTRLVSVFSAVRPRDREKTERPVQRAQSPTQQPASPTRRPQQATPQVVVSRTEGIEISDDGHRRRKIAVGSHRVHPSKSTPRLFNPDADPVPMRRTAEPDVFSEAASSSYGPRNHVTSDRGAQNGRLFDFRKDDPVRFNVLRPTPPGGNRPTPTPKSSGDYVSASSTSSYAHSVTSSSFTLNSTTDGSSVSSALFDGAQPRDHERTSAFAAQLKKLYRAITTLEARLAKEYYNEPVDEGRSLKRPNEATSSSDGEENEQEKWQKFVKDHKQ